MFYLKRRWTRDAILYTRFRPGKWGMGKLWRETARKSLGTGGFGAANGSQFQATSFGIIFHKFATLTCKTPKLLTIYFLILLSWKLKARFGCCHGRKCTAKQQSWKRGAKKKKLSARARFKGPFFTTPFRLRLNALCTAFHNVYVLCYTGRTGGESAAEKLKSSTLR